MALIDCKECPFHSPACDRDLFHKCLRDTLEKASIDKNERGESNESKE